MPNSNSFDNIASPYQLPVVPNSMMMNLPTSPSNLRTVFSLPSISNSTSPIAPTNTALATINCNKLQLFCHQPCLEIPQVPPPTKRPSNLSVFRGRSLKLMDLKMLSVPQKMQNLEYDRRHLYQLQLVPAPRLILDGSLYRQYTGKKKL